MTITRRLKTRIGIVPLRIIRRKANRGEICLGDRPRLDARSINIVDDRLGRMNEQNGQRRRHCRHDPKDHRPAPDGQSIRVDQQHH